MSKISGLVKLVLTIAIVAVPVVVVQNRLAIQDWLALRSYQAPAEVKALADATTMTEKGRNYFYVAQPVIDNKETFNQHCNNQGEQSIVLGCYTGLRIYLYNVTDPRLPNVKEVTAAHEMLHVAYERLDRTDREKIDAQMEAQFKTITDERILGLIELYRKTEPTELYNEMHSIFATEARNLSPELEEYYKQYFVDRLKIVGFSERYEGVFTDSKKRIAAYDVQLEMMKKQIESNETALARMRTEIKNESDRLDQLRESDTQAYNAAVPGYNAKLQEFKQLASGASALINQYNAIVELRNAEAATQAGLAQALDSRITPAQ